MDSKYFVTLRKPEDAQAVRSSGCTILAEYPDSMLVRCEAAQLTTLQQAGLELDKLTQPPVQIAGASFAFDAALAAEAAAPTVVEANRTNYYLVQLVGPAKGEWLDAIRAAGGTLQGALPGYTLLVGLLPAAVPALQAEPWVEAITPYRPAMKVSPKLRPGVTRNLEAADLAAMAIPSTDDERQQVEISVFPNESTATVAALVRNAGGVVLAETDQQVVATVPPQAIETLANEQGVQAILPHAFPELHNDRATLVIGAPVDRTFGALTLRGTNQIVAVADSGLDTGAIATVHADVNGRVDNIVSFPTTTANAPFLVTPPGSDDGAADQDSGHGTHVAGSVLGNGAAATGVGIATVPQGTAPEARLYFQAVGQRVVWKTAAQLIAEGLPVPPNWPPAPFTLLGLPLNLVDLFTPAYTAGARIHTNSWGASDPTLGGTYNANSRAVDTFMWNQRDMLILFSAGNNGRDGDNSGVIDNDSVSPPGTAKNCLTVGASENNRPAGSVPTPGINANWNVLGAGGVPRWPALGPAGHVSDNVDGMAAFSSRGPTDDGRIKPDVVAPGTNVLSMRSSVYVGPPAPLWGDLAAGDPLNGLYCWSGGTSMSTPLVAGAAALIRQHLVEQRGHVQPGVKPSGALIKAFLINGAVNMAGQFAGEIPAGQNNVTGFGRVNLTESLIPGALQQTLFADEPDYAVETGQIRTFEVQAIELTRPLRVTLVWTDAPSPTAAGGLQNQLYLQVRQPGGAVINGDVTAFPTVTNNVQQVVIMAPVAGTYEVRVRGVAITQQAPGAGGGPNPRQDFALAVSNAMGLSLQPASIVQAIDTTGSMAFFGYMEPAKERARQLVDFMRSNDKVAVTEFSERPALPHARTPYPLRLLGSFNPDWSDAHSVINGLFADGFTPIGAGLLEAWNQLHLEPTSRPRAIVLLSDGLNNVPPDPLSILGSIPADVPIFSIALGPAGSTATLQSIANSRPNGGYYVIDADEDIHRLHEIYAQIQALAAGAALVGLSSAELKNQDEARQEMPVEPGVAEVTFTLSWAANGKEMALIVLDPDGKQHNVTAPATAERRDGTYQWIRVAAPKPGQWSLVVVNRGSQEAVKYTISGAVQSPLTLSAEATIIDAEHLGLVARLRRGAKPWDDAKVVAHVTMPTRSRAELLTKFGDRIRAVQLPKVLDEPGLDDEQRLTMQIALFARTFDSDASELFGRKTFAIELFHRGDGVWATEAPILAPGNATVVILASGEIDGVPWQRQATQAVVIGAAPPPQPKLEIRDIFVRRNILWKYTIIGARVVKADGAVATPDDGVTVTNTITQGNQQIHSGPLPYYKVGRYFIWRALAQNLPAGPVTITVEAANGVVQATASKAVVL